MYKNESMSASLVRLIVAGRVTHLQSRRQIIMDPSNNCEKLSLSHGPKAVSLHAMVTLEV